MPNGRAFCDSLEPRVLLAASLVKDVNTITPASFPSSFVDLNGTLLFLADDGAHGFDWWRSDGTAAGTRLVKDLTLGADRVPPLTRRRFAVIGDQMVFPVSAVGAAPALYRTDGTDAGTVRFATTPTTPSFFVPNGAEAFFAAGGQVWKTDGTEAGTVQVSSLGTTAAAKPLAALGDRVLFQAAGPGGEGIELWATDGTAVGTVLLKDINPGAAGSEPGFSPNDGILEDGFERFLVADGRMYFSATTAANGRELWVTDGTPEGTHIVADIVPGPASSSPWEMDEHGGSVYFTANISSGGNNNLNLYRVNPGDNGATLIGSVTNGFPLAMASGGARLLLLALGPASPAPTLYTLNDAGDGLATVRNFQSSGRLLRAFNFARLGDFSYFYLSTGVGQAAPGVSELWRTDGTAAGTTRLAGFPGLEQSLDPTAVFESGGVIYFPGGTTATGTELWRSDGTPEGTRAVLDVNAATTRSSTPTAPVEVRGGRWLFAADDGLNGRQLWVTDGTDPGTRRVSNPSTGSGFNVTPQTGSLVDGVTRATLGVAWNGRVYFAARVGTSNALYSSDGTFGGTREVVSLAPGVTGPTDLFPLGDRLLFSTYESSANRGTLWATDGTQAGTGSVRHFTAGNPTPHGFTALGGAAYFAAATTELGAELWKTDGTTEGTTLVKDIYPGNAGSSPGRLTRHGDSLYFAATGQDLGRELWRTDGTEAGTVLVKDVHPGQTTVSGFPNSSNPSNLRTVNGWLLFEARDAESPTVNRLYRSDGTADETTALTPADFSPNQTAALHLVGEGLVAYFFRQPPGGKPELWRTDGQPETTQRVKVFDSAGIPPTATPVGIDGAFVYVRVTDGTPTSTDPSELWQSDGTGGGRGWSSGARRGRGPTTPWSSATGSSSPPTTAYTATSCGRSYWARTSWAATCSTTAARSTAATSSPTPPTTARSQPTSRRCCRAPNPPRPSPTSPATREASTASWSTCRATCR